VTNSGQKILHTLWNYRLYLILAGILGVLFGGAYALSTYNYIHVQRIMIETQSSSFIQSIGGLPTQRSWANQSYQEATNAVKKINHPDFYKETARELIKDEEFIRSLTQTRFIQIIGILRLEKYFDTPSSQKPGLADIAWNVSNSTSFRVDDDDGIEIRATHMSEIAAGKIAAAAALVGRDYLIRESLNEVEQAIVYINKEIASSQAQISSEGDKLISLASNSGNMPDFEKVIGEEQARLSRDFLSAEIESETNDILIELLGGSTSESKGSKEESYADLIKKRSALAKINELFGAYRRLEHIKLNSGLSDTYESRELTSSIEVMEKNLEDLGYSQTTIKNIQVLAGGGSSLEELIRKNELLKSQMKVSKNLLRDRADVSKKAYNVTLAKESIARARGLLYKNLEFLNSQRFDLELKKISIKNKYSTRTDQRPASTIRTPSIRNMMVFFMIFGIVGASFLILALTSDDPLVMTLSDVPGYTAQQNLGRIHRVSRRALKTKQLTPQVVNDLKIIAQRLFRLTGIATGQATDKVFTVTSARASEGKSFISLQLVNTFVKSGFKALLIDGDLLASKVDWKLYSSAPRSEIEGFEIAHPRNGGDLMSCQNKSYSEISKFINSAAWQKLKCDYDFILIDLPPIVLVPEVAEIVELADRGIFVIASGRHQATTVAQSLDMFAESTKGKPLLLLNFNMEFKIHQHNSGYNGYNDYIYRSRNASLEQNDDSEKNPAA
jgi:hypothetical protein